MTKAGTEPQQEQQQPADSQSVSASLEAIQQALDLHSLVVDNSEDAIYAQDAQGRYLLFNQSACRFMGKTRAEVLGKNDHGLFPVAQADSERHFVVAKRPLCDHDGRIIGTFGIARDITEQKQVEAALRERNEELERFNRATVGRELDMIALKREVNAPAQELGRPPPYDLSALDAASGKNPP